MRQAYDWYERQQPGLGHRFMRALAGAIETILERPMSFPDVHRGVRRAILKKFPYGVFFRRPNHVVRVIAVYDLHRNPKGWQRRV